MGPWLCKSHQHNLVLGVVCNGVQSENENPNASAKATYLYHAFSERPKKSAVDKSSHIIEVAKQTPTMLINWGGKGNRKM